MADENGKGKPFFDRADQVAGTGNWDFAIEMLLLGITKEPNNIARGHQRLREVAMQRRVSGGKSAGFMDKMKRKATKDPVGSLINAEWLMSRDPGEASNWKHIVLAAKDAGLKDVAAWAGGILYDVNRMGKPSKEIYVFLRDVYVQMEMFSEAVHACQAALAMAPNDVALQDSLRDLSAQETIQKGKYDQTDGDFTKSVKDLKGQIETTRKDGVSQNQAFLLDQAEKAKAAYEADPAVPGKITAYVDALTRMDDEGFENEAIDVLTKAFKDIGAYRYRMRIGDIKIRQMRRRRDKLKAAGDKANAAAVGKELLALELAEYAERAANYPTDLGIKYELGRRQFQAGQYDEAIAMLQQARRDPKHRLGALTALGMAFFKKAWYTEAADTFAGALEGDVPEKQRLELLYDLGLCREAMGHFPDAIAHYSDVAQIDFNYRDVRERIEKLRKKAGETTEDDSAAGQPTA